MESARKVWPGRTVPSMSSAERPSWARPALSLSAIGGPCASVRAWILVVRPPHECPCGRLEGKLPRSILLGRQSFDPLRLGVDPPWHIYAVGGGGHSIKTMQFENSMGLSRSRKTI